MLTARVALSGAAEELTRQDVAQRVLDTANFEKLEMLRDLNQIITQPRPAFSFRAWMETRRENYKAWLTRL